MNIGKHISPLLARQTDEEHRTATQLELLFDLVVVIAIAASAHGLVGALEDGHIGLGIVQFGIAFFVIWWPWNMFTWFATSFDNDDIAYRINVMTMMVGIVFVAASLPRIFEGESLPSGFLGYVILRLAFAVLWLRVARANPQYRVTALRYSLGQVCMQLLWAMIVFAIEPFGLTFYILFALAALAELLIPWYAEKAANTPWHRHHLIERFGLLNIIVLGEVLLASTHALEATFAEGFNISELTVAICGAIIAFAMWWLYFCEADHLTSIEVKQAFVWGYGHFLVFGSGAAVGAGLDVLVEAIAHSHGESEHLGTAAFSVSIPIAIYIIGLWIVRDRYMLKNLSRWLLPCFAILIALTGLLPYAPVPATFLLVNCLILRLRCERQLQHIQN
ncbi:MAG: low temperature requirement protein A [Cyanobacteria bacterium J06642_2]